MWQHFYTLGAVAPFRSLVVAHVQPWPATDGYRQRLSNMVEALASVGEVDLFCMEHHLALPSQLPPGVRMVRTSGAKRTVAVRVWRWLTTDSPRELDRWDHRDATATFLRELRLPYDVVLLSHLSAWHDFGDLVDAPTIVDVDNLDSIAHRARAAIRGGEPVTGVARLVDAARRRVDRIDADRMARLEQRCAAHVDAMVLCSELDVRRAGFPNGRVVANGYTRAGATPTGEAGPPEAVPERPELFFVGQLAYAPNSDAVRWFANEVLPLVRARMPEARFRVVGRHPDVVADVEELPGVELVGPVEDLQGELDRAVVAVVPIRFGAGTRLKVVEALANRIPLVSTTIGAEGIDVVEGVHALLADDAAAFADACVRALGEADLRRSLADAGEALWAERYRWSTIRRELVDLARQVAAED